MFEISTKALEKIGLQKAEINIYLALLKNGLSTAANIAQYTKLNRSHIYDKLDVLLEKGLISFVIKNNVKYFKASDPEKIIDYIKEIQSNMQKLIPDLNKIKSIPKPEDSSIHIILGRYDKIAYTWNTSEKQQIFREVF